MPTVYPGIHPDVDLSRFPITEQKILRWLGKCVYITNPGKEIALSKTSIYRFVLFKFPDHLREMFNISREMIWLFSSYADFQARTLDAFERADECFQTYRIERVCRFLASNDPFITKLLDETIKQDPEIPVVVPFSYSELSLSKSEAYFVDRVRRHFYFRDLFAFQSPLKRDIYFFGRQELIHSVLNRARSNENTGIFGLRRSGKTSVVYGLERALRATGDCHLALDCQNTSVYQRRWNDLLKHKSLLLR